jgi:hypothetical protein
MRIEQVCLLALCAVVGVTDAACGAGMLSASVEVDGFTYDDTVPPSGGPQQVGVPMTCSIPNCSLSDQSFEGEELEVGVAGTTDFGQANSIASATASAAIGDLGIAVTGYTLAGSNHSYARVGSNATASWQDRATVFAPTLPLGDTFIVHSFLSLDGELTGTASNHGSTTITLVVSDLPGISTLAPSSIAGNYYAILQEVPELGVHELEEIPGAIAIDIPVRNGLQFALGYSITLDGGAVTENNGFTNPTPSAEDFSGDVSGSVHWGGIVSITDESGNPLDNWTISAESGFDYSKPFGVPEPSSALLFLAGVCVPLALGRSRFRMTRD